MARTKESIYGASKSIKVSEEIQRKLRSKDASAKLVVFNFDNVNGLIYKNETIKLIERKLVKFYKYGGEVANLVSKSVNLEVVGASETKANNGGTLLSTTQDASHSNFNSKNSTPFSKSWLSAKSKSRANKQKDPLADETYEAFHKKMRRDEKIMTNEDRTRMLSDLDNLNSRNKLLHQYDWIRHLPLITHVNDVNNFEELNLKNELTKAEIERLNRKHDNWKKRFEEMTTEIKDFEVYLPEPEVDEYSATLNTLRNRRRKEIVRKFGPRITLNLQNGYCIVMDPILPPRIENTKKWNATKLNLLHSQSVDTAVKTNSLGGTAETNFDMLNSKSDSHTPEQANSLGKATQVIAPKSKHKMRQLTFSGTNMTDLAPLKNGFQLPSTLKRRANGTRKERHLFRKSIK